MVFQCVLVEVKGLELSPCCVAHCGVNELRIRQAQLGHLSGRIQDQLFLLGSLQECRNSGRSSQWPHPCDLHTPLTCTLMHTHSLTRQRPLNQPHCLQRNCHERMQQCTVLCFFVLVFLASLTQWDGKLHENKDMAHVMWTCIIHNPNISGTQQTSNKCLLDGQMSTHTLYARNQPAGTKQHQEEHQNP